MVTCFAINMSHTLSEVTIETCLLEAALSNDTPGSGKNDQAFIWAVSTLEQTHTSDIVYIYHSKSGSKNYI